MGQHQAKQTHCKYGHEFTEANLYKVAGKRRCKECHRKQNRERYHEKALWKTRNHARIALNNILRTHKLTLDQYNNLHTQHDFHCALCDVTENLCVDHDHITGKIRGLLCRNHNCALGLFKDNPDVLRDAAKYLEERA